MAHQTSEAFQRSVGCLLKECTRRKSLAEGKQLHALIIRTRCDKNIFLSNLLIGMYSACGGLVEAFKIFATMPARNLFSWTVMMSAYTKGGRYEDALTLFQQMQQAGIEPDEVACVIALQACADTCALEHGHHLHLFILNKGFESNLIVQTTLLDMYAKCGCLKDARELFDSMSARNVVSWNVMIAGYAQEGLGKEALDLYEQMKREEIEPDRISLVPLLKACASTSALQQGKQLHSLILKKGFESEPIIQTTLIDMYSKCKDLKHAREVFENLTERDVVSWTAMIAGYVREGLGREALDLYKQMKREGVEPNKVTLVFLLKACSGNMALQQGKQLHFLIIENGMQSEPIIQNTLIDMYSKCGCLKAARELFDNMTDRSVVCWNSMIAGYVQEGLGKEALGLYQHMEREGMQPSNVTLILLLKACASISALDEGKQLHSLILEKGLESELLIQNALIDMYSKCRCLKDARGLFDNMIARNVVSWNAMIAGYSQEGFGSEALALYEQMNHGGMEPDQTTVVLLLKACARIPDLQQGRQFHLVILGKGFESKVMVQNTLIDMYSKCGSLKDARELFDNMMERDVVSWTAMIAGYADEGLGKEALHLYEQMKHGGIDPNSITIVLLLKACGRISALQQGKQLHSLILEKSFDTELVVQNSLLDMYSKCGCLKAARELFDNMMERDVVSWNAMIAGYAQEGLGKQVLDLFQQMMDEGLQANDVTLSCVLSACSHSGLVDEGRHVFESMIKPYGVRETQGTLCMHG